jgi:dsRNA-specific ribonuclease
MSTITTIESEIGLSFHNQDLLWQALTHKTYARYLNLPEAHNEWLAVFGDTLLDVIVMQRLYEVYGNRHGKGFISDQRDYLVKDETLILLSEKIRLRELVRVKREGDQIISKDISDSFEALLAAIYLDQGFEVAQSWFVDRFLDPSVFNPNSRATIEANSLVVDIAQVEAAIAHTFHNKVLLQTAITERSYAVNRRNSEDHNEGLALLGDALLDFVVLEYLYQRKGKYGKGKLSTNRDDLVNDTALEVVARRLGLEKFILHNGIVGPKNLTDGVEAVLGAIYLDQGLEAARDWCFKQIIQEAITGSGGWLNQDLPITQVVPGEDLRAESLSSSISTDYSELQALLSTGQWQAADQETKEVMLRVVGQVEFLPKELIDQFPCEDLKTIDQLWVHYSGGRFGFSVQAKTLKEVGGDWDRFSDRIGWRVNGVWQPKDNRLYNLQAPEGHLPSAALRAAGKGAKARAQILNRVEVCRLLDN